MIPGSPGEGNGKEQESHALALCYQIRRAFYFIDRGLVGRSPCMKALREGLWNTVFTYDLDLYNRYLHDRMGISITGSARTSSWFRP